MRIESCGYFLFDACSLTLSSNGRSSLVDEVDAETMQDQTAEHEIRKRSL